jgi:N-acetylglutamate synthase-like GNAT family acetyltransferase
MTKQPPTCRVAVPDDGSAILAIFAEVAPKVPTAVRDGTKELIERFAAVGDSLVAVDPEGNIVGYALVWPDRDDAIELVYLGVATASQNQGACSSLVSGLKTRNVAINASVRHNNTSSMADRFKRLGFAVIEVREGEQTKFRWEPSKQDQPAV